MRRWLTRLGVFVLVAGSCAGKCGYDAATGMADNLVGRGEQSRLAHLKLWPKAKTQILLAQGLEQELALDGPRAAGLGCRLPWSFGKDAAAAAAHEQACPGRPAPLSLEVIGALSEGRTSDVALPEPPAWQGAQRWACLEDAPFAGIEADPWRHNVAFWPALDASQLRGLVRLHLLHAERARRLNVAVLEQLQLARVLLDCEVMSVQLSGVALLATQREWLDKRGAKVSGLPGKEQIELLRASRFAASQALHPWLVDGESDDVRDSLAPPARCAAVLESSFWALYSPLLEERHAAYLTRMRDEAVLKAWCEHPRALAPWLASRQVPEDVWERINEGLQLGKDAGWPMRLAKVSTRARAATAELILAIATPKPVRE